MDGVGQRLRGCGVANDACMGWVSWVGTGRREEDVLSERSGNEENTTHPACCSVLCILASCAWREASASPTSNAARAAFKSRLAPPRWRISLSVMTVEDVPARVIGANQISWRPLKRDEMARSRQEAEKNTVPIQPP
jgi:hypothetical protein